MSLLIYLLRLYPVVAISTCWPPALPHSPAIKPVVRHPQVLGAPATKPNDSSQVQEDLEKRLEAPSSFRSKVVMVVFFPDLRRFFVTDS